MNNEDAKWIEEKVTPVIDLPEAPGSIHIDSYLDGFHVGWTKRLTDPKISKELFNIKAFVQELKDQGFKPSWNEQTNEATQKPQSLGKCSKCGAENKLSSKGKPYCSALCWKK